MEPQPNEVSSSGHLLGQIIGDWWERFVVLPLLEQVARKLDLFADCRYVERQCRGDKIHWRDLDNNIVDYDFVLELGGTRSKNGVPVAFLESFWRRGARHSKDKARDDTNKLLPMRDTYPSARFLAIAACGEFTQPARDYVKSMNVNLLYVPKTHIVAAFSKAGLVIDYPDKMSEENKSRIASTVQKAANEKLWKSIADNLMDIVGEGLLNSFTHTVISAPSAQPQEIRICESLKSDYMRFKSVDDASAFLKSPKFNHNGNDYSYTYEVTYSDGTEFSRDVENLKQVSEIHAQVMDLVRHMNKVNRELLGVG